MTWNITRLILRVLAKMNPREVWYAESCRNRHGLVQDFSWHIPIISIDITNRWNTRRALLVSYGLWYERDAHLEELDF